MINGRYVATRNGVPIGVMPIDTYDPDKDGLIALAQLVDAVCSETEADNKITAHAGAVDPHGDRAYAAGIVRTIVSGSYNGNETARQITTGFKCSMVIILLDGSNPQSAILIPNRTIVVKENGMTDKTSDVYLHASDGFALSTNVDWNWNSGTYYYWAISE